MEALQDEIDSLKKRVEQLELENLTLRKIQVPSATHTTTVTVTTACEKVVNLKVLRSALGQCGNFNIEAFETSSKVITRVCEAKDEDIHCVFTDCIMPVVTGSQVTAAIRQHEHLRRCRGDIFRPVYICAVTTETCPIFLASCYHAGMKHRYDRDVSNFFLASCYHAGMNAIIQKPVTTEKIRECFEKLAVYRKDV